MTEGSHLLTSASMTGHQNHARRAHPALRFDEARMKALPIEDGALAHYSVIHTSPKELLSWAGLVPFARSDWSTIQPPSVVSSTRTCWPAAAPPPETAPTSSTLECQQ
ncbi:hypothetical protein ABH940_000852 [Streptacidiphilus sp. BW17]